MGGWERGGRGGLTGVTRHVSEEEQRQTALTSAKDIVHKI